MSHLGSRISALVDGQLDPAATERALAHVAGCRGCALELGQARAARRALAQAAEVAPAPDLTSRLLSLASQCPPDVPGDPFAAPSPRLIGPLGSAAYTVPARGLRGDVTGRSRARLGRGALAGAGAVAAALFVLGARPVVVPSAHPGADLGLLGGAVSSEGSTVDVLADDTGTPAVQAETTSWLRDHSWTFPQSLPDGWTVTAVRWSGDDDDVLEVDLAGPDGPVVLTEQQGRLDTEALADAQVQTVQGCTVYVLSTSPWHVVWQSDATVVEAVAAQSSDSVQSVVAAFPGGTFDDGVPARITRGWDTVTGVFAQP
ncbi:zf-HC2 domain-containing protein [Cellulomonas soli]|uniref:zf-HC2 domain-containing protein n=1 Tax=Cellulomonas soli TaxID=931535 RepID=UPI003F848E97